MRSIEIVECFGVRIKKTADDAPRVAPLEGASTYAHGAYVSLRHGEHNADERK